MSEPRIIVLGGAGMLGHKLFQILRERFPGTMATMRDDPASEPLSRVELLQGSDVIPRLDVTDFHRFGEILRELRPDFVVNAAGVIKQKNPNSVALPSIAVNSLLPHWLAETLAPWGGRLIHFSSDCVFSGSRGNYRVSDRSDADDLYGRSKYLGEVAAANAVTLRTSIIGRELKEHRSLLDWFLSQRGKRVLGYRKVIYSGSTTNEMAEVVTRLITRHPHLTGLYQVVSRPISKHDLLSLLRDAYRVDIEIEPYDLEVSDRSMIGEEFRAVTGYEAPSWPELVAALAEDPTPYREWGTSVL